MIKLNISCTLVKKLDIIDLFGLTKKYVNTLVISEDQYSEHLLNLDSKVY
jgi:hypothetical protein